MPPRTQPIRALSLLCAEVDLYFTTGPSLGKGVDQDANGIVTGIGGKRLPTFCMTDWRMRWLFVSA